MHTTNKEFERYYRGERDDLRSIDEDTRIDEKIKANNA
jgi:hypothetical protein